MLFLNDPVNFISEWMRSLLSGWGLPSGLVTAIIYFIGITVLVVFAMVLDILLVWV